MANKPFPFDVCKQCCGGELTNEEKQEIIRGCANAFKGTASDTVVQLNDISPLQETIKVKVSGVDDPTKVTVTKCGKSLFDLSGLDVTLKHLYNAGGILFDVRNFRGKTLCYQRTVDFTNTIEDTAIFSTKVVVYAEDKKTILKQHFAGAGLLNKNSNTRISQTYYTVGENDCYAGFGYQAMFNSTAAPQPGSTMTISNGMVEFGTKRTEYEPYAGETFTPNTDGTLYIPSQSPVMTLYTDTNGTNIECEYNRDSNKVIEKLTNAIISLGGNI